MIKRYSNYSISGVWKDKKKFERWLLVELMIIWGREHIGQIPRGISEMFEKIKFIINVKSIEKIEKTTHHDMNAFIDFIRQQIPSDLQRYFHSGGITSYDIEEPSQALALVESAEVVCWKIKRLLRVLRAKALATKNIVMIGRTHGQHAEPTTLGKKLLGYYDSINRSYRYLNQLMSDLEYSKISGAVGAYGHGLSVRLESLVLGRLGLRRAETSTQIICRDRIARYFSEVGILSSILDDIATDFRLLSQTEIREIQEPFSKNQTGSSVMPHKKNPITWEKISGLARIVRSYLQGFLENIVSWNERDISQSSAERIAIPDTFHAICHQLDAMTKTIKGLTINEDKIQENLNSSYGVMISPLFKDLLIEHGMDPKKAYLFCQELGIRAVQEKRCFLDLVEEEGSRIPQDILELDKVLDTMYDQVYGYPKEIDVVFSEIFKSKKE